MAVVQGDAATATEWGRSRLFSGCKCAGETGTLKLSRWNAMTQLHMERCELTYEGAFVKPAFWLIDSPGKLCDLLLDALGAFGCTSADLVLEEGEPGERGVTCEVDESALRVSGRSGALQVLGTETAATVYFFADPSIERNVLGRHGWLDRLRFGLVDY